MFFLREAPYDEIAYHIRKSRGLRQPRQAELKFGSENETKHLKTPDTESDQFNFSPDESLETSFLGFVSFAKLDEKVVLLLLMIVTFLITRNLYSVQLTLHQCDQIGRYFGIWPTF